MEKGCSRTYARRIKEHVHVENNADSTEKFTVHNSQVCVTPVLFSSWPLLNMICKFLLFVIQSGICGIERLNKQDAVEN